MARAHSAHRNLARRAVVARNSEPVVGHVENEILAHDGKSDNSNVAAHALLSSSSTPLLR